MSDQALIREGFRSPSIWRRRHPTTEAGVVAALDALLRLGCRPNEVEAYGVAMRAQIENGGPRPAIPEHRVTGTSCDNCACPIGGMFTRCECLCHDDFH